MLAALAAAITLFAELGPAVGSTIPQTERFKPHMGEAGATIVFVRSVVWCPYCRKQVTELAGEADAFAAEGRPLVFVSYDDREKQAVFAEEQMIGAAFIADEGSELIRAFGILNENHAPGSRVHGIPHPIVLVVDAQGTVKAKLHEEDYATNARSYQSRPAVETILAAVRGAE